LIDSQDIAERKVYEDEISGTAAMLAAATLPPPLTRAQVPVFAITPVHSKATSTGLDNRGPLALGHLMDWPTSLKTGF
jgi:hypothetical protein